MPNDLPTPTDRLQEILDNRIENYNLPVTHLEKNVIYTALGGELDRQYANYGRRVLHVEEGNCDTTLRRIDRIRALMRRIDRIRALMDRVASLI